LCGVFVRVSFVLPTQEAQTKMLETKCYIVLCVLDISTETCKLAYRSRNIIVKKWNVVAKQ